MTIHYEVTVQDYVNFNLYHLEISKSGKIIRMLMILLPLSLFVMPFLRLISRRGNADEMLGHVIAVIIVAAVSSLTFYLFLRLTYTPLIKWQAKMQLKDGKANDFIGEQVLTLHDDYIEGTNAQMTSRINYSAIEKICYGYDCYFIYIGAVKAIIVPHRCFTDSPQRDAFIANLKQKTGHDVMYRGR